MKIMKMVIFALVILGAILILVGLFLPSKKHIERAIAINAPVERIFNNVNNLNRRLQWDTWKENYPEMEFIFGDIIAGKGASFTWIKKSGDRLAYDGFLSIEESVPYQVIRTRILSQGRWKGEGLWTFTSADDGILVVQRFENDAGDSIKGKYSNLFIDSILGESLEKRLEKLKDFSERGR